MTDFDEEKHESPYRVLYTGPCLMIAILIVFVAVIFLAVFMETF